MSRRWVNTSDGKPIARRQSLGRFVRIDHGLTYTRDEVEALMEKTARAHGIDPICVRPHLGRITPKSADEIAAEHAARQRLLRSQMEEQLGRVRREGRSATAFVQPDGSEVNLGGDGSVTRLELSPPVLG